MTRIASKSLYSVFPPNGPKTLKTGLSIWVKKKKKYLNCWVTLMSSSERCHTLQLWPNRVKGYRFCHTIILYQGANANKTVLCCTITDYVKTCFSICWKALKQSMHIKNQHKDQFSWDKFKKQFLFSFNSKTLARTLKNKEGFISRNKVWLICKKKTSVLMWSGICICSICSILTPPRDI